MESAILYTLKAHSIWSKEFWAALFLQVKEFLSLQATSQVGVLCYN